MPGVRAFRRRAYRRHRGLVLLTLMIALLLLSVAMAGALDVWALQRQRYVEEELLFVGNQYRQAILSYYMVGHTLPMSIDDLLEDKRFPNPLHHLRRAYADPVTGKNDWQLLRDGDRIFGIYSKSTAETIKRANFPRQYAEFADTKTYAEWRFFYIPPGRRDPGNTLSPGLPGQNTGGSRNRPPGSANGTSPFAPLMPRR